MKYVPPGLPGSIVSVEPRYENFVGGKWLAPTHGKYRLDLAPATASRSPRWPTPRRRMSSSRWTLPTRRRTAGARRQRPSEPRCSTRSPMRSRRTRRCWRSLRAGRTASRSARPWLPTFPWWSITSGTSPQAARAEEGHWARSRRTWSPTTSGLREEDRRREAGVSNPGYMHAPGGVVGTPFTHTMHALGVHGTSGEASTSLCASVPVSGEASTAGAASCRISPAAPPVPAPVDPPPAPHAAASGTRAASTPPHPIATRAKIATALSTVFIVEASWLRIQQSPYHRQRVEVLTEK